jgi:hypothetical protein
MTFYFFILQKIYLLAPLQNPLKLTVEHGCPDFSAEYKVIKGIKLII